MRARVLALLITLGAGGAAVLLWTHGPWRAEYAVMTPGGEADMQHGRFSTRDLCERMLLRIGPTHPHHRCDQIRR